MPVLNPTELVVVVLVVVGGLTTFLCSLLSALVEVVGGGEVLLLTNKVGAGPGLGLCSLPWLWLAPLTLGTGLKFFLSGGPATTIIEKKIRNFGYFRSFNCKKTFPLLLLKALFDEGFFHFKVQLKEKDIQVMTDTDLIERAPDHHHLVGVFFCWD